MTTHTYTYCWNGVFCMRRAVANNCILLLCIISDISPISEQRYCPSFCDSSGKLSDGSVCLTVQHHCCKFSNNTLGCCKNQSLAIGDNINEEYNCEIPLLETYVCVHETQRWVKMA